MPFSRAMTALTSPASPLTPSRWPILDFNAPLEYMKWVLSQYYSFKQTLNVTRREVEGADAATYT